jgi:hypothetical protein
MESLELRRREVPAGAVQTALVVPIDPLERRRLDVFDGAPRTSART